jgi:hypothetical protein
MFIYLLLPLPSLFYPNCGRYLFLWLEVCDKVMKAIVHVLVTKAPDVAEGTLRGRPV